MTNKLKTAACFPEDISQLSRTMMDATLGCYFRFSNFARQIKT